MHILLSYCLGLLSFSVLFLTGVCPQENVLFDFLTVKEHLEFFAGLKEVPRDEIESVVSKAGSFARLEMATDTVANATKMVRLATRRFDQEVVNLATSKAYYLQATETLV